MIPTVQQIFLATRAVLADIKTVNGETYTNAVLQPFYQAAYSELFMALQNAQGQRLRRTVFYNLPINTGYLAPATAGISSFGGLESIEERGGVTAWAISAATPGAGICTLTNAASTLATGNQAVVYAVAGLTDDVNDIWTVTVNSPTSTQLNGCAATGIYTSGGVLSFSAESFNWLTPQNTITTIDSSPGNTLGEYALETGVIRFRPANQVRQLRITYWLSGDAPLTTTASTGIDNCQTFLSFRIAGMAAESRGMMVRAQLYNDRALGPGYDATGIIGGVLGQMLDAVVRDLQRTPSSERRSPPYGGTNYRRDWNRIF